MRLSCKTCSTSGTSWQKILQSYSIFLRIFSCKMKDCLQSSYMTTFQHVTNLQDTVNSQNTDWFVVTLKDLLQASSRNN